MAGIQLGGLSSGMDTASIIEQLMNAEKIPRKKLTLEQDATTKRQSLLQEISSKLTTLKFANDDLKSVLSWGDTQTVESADPTKFTATRTAGAAPGGFDVGITQLASAARQTFKFVSPAADGTIEIKNPDNSARASIALKAGATVDDAVAAINDGTSGSNLYAVNVNGNLVLSAKTTGDKSGFQISGNGLDSQLESVDGTNSKITVNGTAYERQTNTITDAVAGVTLTLKGKTAGTDTVGLNVGTPGPDKEKLVEKVKSFITAYNALVTVARADVSEKQVIKASNTADAQKGTLFNDTGLSTMLSQFRTTLSNSVDGLSGLKSMGDLGVTTGAASATLNQDSLDGKLTLDETKLRTALDTNPNGVRALLGGSGANGFSQAFAGVLSSYQGSAGLIQQRIAFAASDLTDLTKKLDRFDARMETRQAQLQRQFTAMEMALSSSNSSGSNLSNLLAQSDR